MQIYLRTLQSSGLPAPGSAVVKFSGHGTHDLIPSIGLWKPSGHALHEVTPTLFIFASCPTGQLTIDNQKESHFIGSSTILTDKP